MGVEYVVRNIEEDDSNFQEVIHLGYQQVPVVVDGDQSWSGHQPSKLMQLK
jgi:glutaredoxin-like protein NrdH